MESDDFDPGENFSFHFSKSPILMSQKPLPRNSEDEDDGTPLDFHNPLFFS
jgi:hypothetical protein